MSEAITVALAALAAMLLTAGAALAGPAATNVPEPASLALLATGVGVLAVVRHLRGKK